MSAGGDAFFSAGSESTDAAMEDFLGESSNIPMSSSAAAQQFPGVDYELFDIFHSASTYEGGPSPMALSSSSSSSASSAHRTAVPPLSFGSAPSGLTFPLAASTLGAGKSSPTAPFGDPNSSAAGGSRSPDSNFGMRLSQAQQMSTPLSNMSGLSAGLASLALPGALGLSSAPSAGSSSLQAQYQQAQLQAQQQALLQQQRQVHMQMALAGGMGAMGGMSGLAGMAGMAGMNIDASGSSLGIGSLGSASASSSSAGSSGGSSSVAPMDSSGLHGGDDSDASASPFGAIGALASAGSSSSSGASSSAAAAPAASGRAPKRAAASKATTSARAPRKPRAKAAAPPPPPVEVEETLDDDDDDDDGDDSPATPASTHYSAPYYNASRHADKAEKAAAKEDASGGEGKQKKKHNAKTLARKAELARASRRRKKLYIQDLENKVKKLGAKIEELQQKQSKQKPSNKGSAGREEKDRREEQAKVREKLAELVKKENIDKATAAQLTMLVRQFAVNSRERQAMANFYLDRVEDCLVPGLQVRFALWGLDQGDDFYNKPGLWQSLMTKELGMSPEQMTALVSRRAAIHKERQNLARCEQMLKETRNAIRTHLTSLNSEMDEIQKIMSPQQLARFYVWIEQNEWCMQMLGPLSTAP